MHALVQLYALYQPVPLAEDQTFFDKHVDHLRKVHIENKWKILFEA